MKTEVCPDDSVLKKFLLGNLPDVERESIAEHLSACEQCLTAAGNISAVDDLTEAIQSYQESDEDNSLLTDIIEQGKQLLPVDDTVQSQETVFVGKPQQPASESVISNLSGAVYSPEDIAFLAPAESDDELGRLGNYRVLDVLGIGGMGIVFRGEDPELQRQVAIKAMKPSIAVDDSAKERFLQEARITASIEHHNIVPIYQVSEDRGVPFIAMQFLRGESLQTRLERNKPLNQEDALQIGREVATGLAAAHERHLIHRDIKPDNIWIDEATGWAKILDFGLARVSKEDSGITHSGLIVGTPRYMSPEQAQGGDIDPRCDLFSLGSVLYRLITGKLAFNAENITATLLAVVSKEPTPVEELRPDVDPELAALIRKLLSKNREDRPVSALEVAEQIAAIEQKLKAEPQTTPASKTVDATIVNEPVSTIVDLTAAYVPPKNRSGSRAGIFWAAFGFLILAGIITIATKKGTVTVDIADKMKAGVEVKIKTVNGDKEIAVLDKANNWTVNLTGGEYSIDLNGGNDEFSLKDNTLTVSRFGQNFVKMEYTPNNIMKDRNAKKSKPGEWNDRKVAEWVLSVGGKIKTNLGEVRSVATLPADSFHITQITLSDQKKLAGKNLSFLAVLSHLVQLDLRGTDIGDAELAHLGTQTGLVFLNLNNTNVSDAGMTHIGRLTALKSLDLRGAAVGDSGLTQLKSLSELRELWLYGTKVSDAGLQHLEGLTKLTLLDLHGTDVTPEGVAKLQKALTNCEVRHESIKNFHANYALQFDGKDDYVQIDNIELLTDTGTMPTGHTIEAWVSFGGFRGHNSSVLKIYNNYFLNNLYADRESGQWRNWITSRETNEACTPWAGKALLNQRIHLASTSDGTWYNLYVNGKLAGLIHGDAKVRIPNLAKPGEKTEFSMGGRPSWGDYYQGQIDEVRISRGRRYTGKEFVPEKRFKTDKDTIALYHFDEGQGDVLKDSSGNNHHGKIHGATWVKVDSRKVEHAPENGVWKPGPETDVLPGLIPRPAKLSTAKRWQLLPLTPQRQTWQLKHLGINPKKDLLAVTTGNYLYIHKIPDFKLVTVIRHPHEQKHFFKHVAWSPDGKSIANISERNCSIWDISNGDLLSTWQIKSDEKYLYNVCWSPDGKKLVTSQIWEGNAAIKIWSLDGKLLKTLNHGGPNSDIAWSGDGKFLACASDPLLTVWETESWKQVHQVNLEGNISSVEWSPDSKWLAAGGFKQVIHLWKADDWQEERQLKGHRSHVNDVAWSPDSKFLASAGQDTSARLWDVRQSKTTVSYPHRLHTGQTHAVSVGISHKGEWMISVGMDGFRLYDIREKTLGPHYPMQEIKPVIDDSKNVVVALSENQSVKFSEAGELLEGDLPTIDKYLICLIEQNDGSLVHIKPSALLKSPSTADTGEWDDRKVAE